MKKLLVVLSLMFVGIASATTINLDWIVDGNTYAQTTCESGGNLNIPSTTPTKRGYHFIGWDLPDYTQLEYIESTGTQYIDTGIVLTTVASEMYVDVQKTVVSNGQAFVGAQTAPKVLRQILYVDTDYSLRWYNGEYNDTTTYGVISSTSANTRHKYHITSNSSNQYRIEVDGVLVSTGTQPASSNINVSLYLFAKNENNSAAQLSSARIYSFWLKNSSGTLVRNLIPAKRNSDNVLGMYDTVTSTFFTNQGTGDFVAGPVSANQTLE